MTNIPIPKLVQRLTAFLQMPCPHSTITAGLFSVIASGMARSEVMKNLLNINADFTPTHTLQVTIDNGYSYSLFVNHLGVHYYTSTNTKNASFEDEQIRGAVNHILASVRKGRKVQAVLAPCK